MRPRETSESITGHAAGEISSRLLATTQWYAPAKEMAEGVKEPDKAQSDTHPRQLGRNQGKMPSGSWTQHRKVNRIKYKRITKVLRYSDKKVIGEEVLRMD